MLLLLCSILIYHLEQLNNRYNNNKKQIRSVFHGTYSDSLDEKSLGLYIELTEFDFSNSDLQIQLCLSISDVKGNILYDKYFPFVKPSDQDSIDKIGKTFVVLPKENSFKFSFSYIYLMNNKITFNYQSEVTTVELPIDQNEKSVTIKATGISDLTIKFKVSSSSYVKFNDQFKSVANGQYFTQVSLDGKDYILVTMKDNINLVDSGSAISEYQSKSSNDKCLFNSSPLFAQLTFDKITYKPETTSESANVRLQIYYDITKDSTTTTQKIYDKFRTITKSSNGKFEEIFKDIKFRFEMDDADQYGNLSFEVTEFIGQNSDSYTQYIEKENIRNFINKNEKIGISNDLFELDAHLTALKSSYVQFIPTSFAEGNTESVILGKLNFDVSKSGHLVFKFSKNEKYLFLNLLASDDKLKGLNFYFKYGDIEPVMFLDGESHYFNTYLIEGDVSYITKWNTTKLGVLITRKEASDERNVDIRYLLGDDVSKDIDSINTKEKSKNKISKAAMIGIIVSAVLVVVGISIGIYCSVRKCKNDSDRREDSSF